VDREPTGRVISDAAYEGLGGWSPEYRFKWRLNRDDLIYAGFHMKLLEESAIEPAVDASGIHINVLEFVAIRSLTSLPGSPRWSHFRCVC
jgi:hypothetical protein